MLLLLPKSLKPSQHQGRRNLLLSLIPSLYFSTQISLSLSLSILAIILQRNHPTSASSLSPPTMYFYLSSFSLSLSLLKSQLVGYVMSFLFFSFFFVLFFFMFMYCIVSQLFFFSVALSVNFGMVYVFCCG